MKTPFIILLATMFFTISCGKEIRNIAEPVDDPIPTPGASMNTDVNPVDINSEGFDLLENMQGHWIGTNMVIADQYPWFCFDYRAISSSQVSGIFEGGTMGNLFTSFFVTDYKNTRTIMARNGGVLSGIYRTSYFVLDSVDYSSNGDFYRLVDAKNGTAVMWMELLFRSDSLYFNAYTSRLGELLPTLHMSFKAKKEHLFLAQEAQQATGFPTNTPAWDFSGGFNENWFYQNPNSEFETATFMSQGQSTSVYDLALQSGDPYTISDHPRLSSLEVNIVRNALITNKNTFVYLSIDPLTDGNGYLNQNNFNSILYFPEVVGTEDDFLFTYLHPGDYYITVIADANNDGFVSAGDVTHVSQSITIAPQQQEQIIIDNINVQN